MNNTTEQLSETLEFIKLGNKVSLNFNVGVNYKELQAACNLIGQMNAFEPLEVSGRILQYTDVISRVQVGLEGSAVVYIWPAYWKNQAYTLSDISHYDKPKDKKIEQAELVSRWKSMLKLLIKEEAADSVSYFSVPEEKTIYLTPHLIDRLEHAPPVRIWWD